MSGTHCINVYARVNSAIKRSIVQLFSTTKETVNEQSELLYILALGAHGCDTLR